MDGVGCISVLPDVIDHSVEEQPEQQGRQRAALLNTHCGIKENRSSCCLTLGVDVHPPDCLYHVRIYVVDLEEYLH